MSKFSVGKVELKKDVATGNYASDCGNFKVTKYLEGQTAWFGEAYIKIEGSRQDLYFTSYGDSAGLVADLLTEELGYAFQGLRKVVEGVGP